MSLDDSQQEDCTVYIEELKSDNPSLKLNAAGKLPVIASVLGHNRIRDQLVPYLIEIIQQMDNENQFLIKVCQGLFELKPFCKNFDECYILIPPLKILASLDQPSVRQKAVQSIQKLINNLDKNFHQSYIYPLILEMSDKKNPYSPRVSASCLLSSCYPFLREQYKLQLQKTFKKLGIQQNSPLVRRSVAENITAYTAVVPKAVTKTDVLEIWQKFIKDKIDIVKIKALQNANTLARFFKKDQINQKMFKYIKDVDVDKKAWRIRYALAESITSILAYLDKELIKKDSVQIFEQLLKDTQAQVRTIAILKVSQLAQKLSQQQSYSIFFEYIEKASKDTSINVRLALIQILADYLATIDKQKIKENGITLIMNLIKDDNQNIRTGLIQKIKDLHRVIGQQNTNQHLLPLIQNSLTDKKWRFKLAVAQTIKDLFSNIDYESHKQFFNKVTKTFLKDHYYAVRQQTMNSLINLKGILGSQKSMQIIGQHIKSLINQANYVYRVSSVQFLMKSHSCLDKSDFNQLFIVVCKAIQNQKVPNVLITFLNHYPKVKSYLNGQGKKQFQNVFRKCKEFNDEDVQYYAAVIQD